MSEEDRCSPCPLLKKIKTDVKIVDSVSLQDEAKVTKEENLEGFSPKTQMGNKNVKKEGSTPDGKTFSCSQCSKMFACANSLRRHVLNHSGDRPFSCSMCSRTFSRACNMKRHMLLHTGEKPYSCSQCSRSFTRLDHMKQHALIHTSEKQSSKSSQNNNGKPHSSDIDSKAIVQAFTVMIDMMIPTGENQYCCPYCPKIFSWPSDIKRHMLGHTGLKPYSCSLCSKSFTRFSNLKRHMQVHAD